MLSDPPTKRAGYSKFDSLEECAQFCNDVDTCAYFLWIPSKSDCGLFAEECKFPYSNAHVTIYEKNTCVGFNKGETAGVQEKRKGELSTKLCNKANQILEEYHFHK